MSDKKRPVKGRFIVAHGAENTVGQRQVQSSGMAVKPSHIREGQETDAGDPLPEFPLDTF